MGDKEIVYKVGTYVEEGKFASAFVQANEWQLFYETGKTTTPHEGSCIFAFDTLENAALWITFSLHRVIWKSEAVVVNEHPPWMSTRTDPIGLRNFWIGEILDRSPIVPYGTIWCSELTPIEEVKGPWNILH